MLGAAILKDMQLVLRDRGALLSLFLLPIIFVSVFGSMFKVGDGRGAPRELLVFIAPDSAAATRVEQALAASGAFVPRAVSSPDEVRRRVAAERGAVGLIVSAEFDPAAGVPAEIVIDTAASPRFRGPIEGAIAGVVARAYFGVDGGATIDLVRAASPPGLKPPLEVSDGFQVSVPGNAILFGFFLALTVGLSFVEERRTGTWRRLLAAPVRRPVLLVAKLVPFFLIGLVQMAFLFAVGHLAFGMRVAGSLPALVILTVVVVLCATALGLFIASFGGSEKQVGGVGSICLLVMGLLGGAMMPRMNMPETLQTIGLGTPHAWALEGYYDLLIREGTTLSDVAGPICAVSLFTVLFATIGALRFRFEK